MKSKWLYLKPKAIQLRKNGESIRDIENSLCIPKSTLSGWFKNIKLTEQQKTILKDKHDKALITARKGAVKWHNEQKYIRLKDAEIDADKTLQKINNDREIIELGLALLYLGEGSKTRPTTSIGNSDPLILKFFLQIITKIYNIKIDKISFYLHLRADQNPELMKKYWSNELKVPIERFGKASIDKRTIKTKTYSHYKGVCVVSCGKVAIQRKLVYIGRKFCENIIKNLGD